MRYPLLQIKSLQQSIGAAEKAAKSLSNKDESKDALALLKQAKDVVNGLGPGGDLRKFCKPRNPMLVRMLLGDKVNMVAIRRDVSQVCLSCEVCACTTKGGQAGRLPHPGGVHPDHFTRANRLYVERLWCIHGALLYASQRPHAHANCGHFIADGSMHVMSSSFACRAFERSTIASVTAVPASCCWVH